MHSKNVNMEETTLDYIACECSSNVELNTRSIRPISFWRNIIINNLLQPKPQRWKGCLLAKGSVEVHFLRKPTDAIATICNCLVSSESSAMFYVRTFVAIFATVCELQPCKKCSEMFDRSHQNLVRLCLSCLSFVPTLKTNKSTKLVPSVHLSKSCVFCMAGFVVKICCQVIVVWA